MIPWVRRLIHPKDFLLKPQTVGVIGTSYLTMLVVHLNKVGEYMVAPVCTKVKFCWLWINGEKKSVSFYEQTQHMYAAFARFQI